MKKLVSLILVLIFVFMLGTVTYAANDGTDIPDSGVPGAPAENVIDKTYDDIKDEDIARGDAGDSSVETIDIGEEEPPKADALPATGGIPAEAFYVAGALLIVAALILSRKKATAK